MRDTYHLPLNPLGPISVAREVNSFKDPTLRIPSSVRITAAISPEVALGTSKTNDQTNEAAGMRLPCYSIRPQDPGLPRWPHNPFKTAFVSDPNPHGLMIFDAALRSPTGQQCRV